MNYLKSQDERLAADAVKRIADDAIAPHAAKTDGQGVFPWEALRALAAAGFLGMGVSKEYAGTETSTTCFTSAVEEIARACGSTALAVVSHTAACRFLTVAGSESHQQSFLPALARGERLGAFAVHEAASGANAAAIETHASPDGDHYLVNGSKFFITNAGEAEVYMVLVRAPGGLSILIVEKGTPGLDFGKVDDRMGFRGVSSRELVFRDCRVPRSNLLGKEGTGLAIVGQAVVGFAFFGAAAVSLGLSRCALDAAVAHARQRTVAGQPIGSHQGVQFHLADMATELDAARALVHTAAREADESPASRAVAAAKAKLFASEMAVRVTDHALQVMGGHGYCREFPVERCCRDARGLTLHFKTSELLRADIAKSLLGT